MDIKTEREAFEAWYCRNHTGLKQSDLAKFRTLSGYSFSDSLKINISWEAWQAAKAQAVLEQVLDAPACVGGGTFQIGVKWSTVIGAAQRHYENDGHHEAPAICIRDQLRVASGHSVVVPKSLTHADAVKISDNGSFCEVYQNILLNDDTSEDAAAILIQTVHEAMIEAQEQKG